MSNYVFEKFCRLDQLESEIRSSAIITALDYINGSATETTVYFKAALSSADETILSTVVNAHIPQAVVQPAQAVKVEEQPPFAKPDYRTKRDGASTWVDVIENAVAQVDYQLTEERYVSGGECIVVGAKKGDWISAEVVDANGLIPEAYRASLCEAWPVVAEYVIKANLVPNENAKEYILNTYPLNAKISAGLVLRIKYHASSEVGTRSFVSNYYLTKKII